MKIYRVALVRLNGDGSGGYEYCRTLREARAFDKSVHETDECTIDTIDVKCTKRGIISALNAYGGHPDNG